MIGVLTSLCSALCFGLSDFAGGFASRRVSYLQVAIVGLAVSVAGAWIVVVLSPRGWPAPAIGWGVCGGLGAAVGSTALYRGFGKGFVTIVGPLSGLGAACLPVLAGIVLGERLRVQSWVGIVLGLVAIVLLSSPGGGGSTSRSGPAITDGVLSGAGFGLEFIALERAGDDSGLLPVAVSQTTAFAVVGLLMMRGGRLRFDWSRSHGWAALCGFLSLVATAAYFLASQLTSLSSAAVLSSLYPVVPVILSVALLHERPPWIQWVGVVLDFLAIYLIVA